MEDIRKNTDVKRVVAEMRGSGEFELEVSSCKSIVYPDITMPLGDLAFWMRDRCNCEKWYLSMRGFHRFRDESISDKLIIKRSTPEQWIEAAVKAWDSKAADAAGDAE